MTLKRGHDLPESERREGSVPVVSSSGITGYHHEAKALAPGVVTGRYGTLGEVFYIEQDYWPLNTALYAIDFKGNHPRFVAYFLQHALSSYQSDKAAVPGVNRNVLHGLKVKAPDRDTQERIAQVLSAYDDLIENNERRMALLEEAVRQVYLEWFVRLRFPGHEHTKIVDGVPEGWEQSHLRDVADVNQRSLSSSFEGQIFYVDISSVTPGKINEHATLDFRDAPSRARRVVKHGDIIWSCVRPNRRSHAIIWEPSSNLIVSTGFAVITPRLIPTSYLYEAVTTDGFVGYLEKQARGAAYPAVTAADFQRARILVPPQSLLQVFDDAVDPAIGLAANLSLQNKSLRAARDLLLPRLMTGEIAV